MNMKIFNVTNPKRFLDRLGKCEGGVYVVTPNGGLQDIKRYAEALRTFCWMGGQLNLPNEFELLFERRDDAIMMLHFLTECSSSAA